MDDTRHRTDTLNPNKVVIVGKQILQWIEFQLLDEQGEPLAHLPYRAVNEATRVAYIEEYSGHSDAQGVIRLEGLHPLALTLLVAAEPLAELLQGRRLRGVRSEPRRPIISDRTPMHAPQRSGFSPIEQQAREAGHAYHYLRIGQLCDQAPTFEPPLPDPEQLPVYHFPDPGFGGFTVSDLELDRRHVLEVCPFRAWSLLLHHQPGYSLANAYNLGLMSILAYSTKEPGDCGSAEEFFLQQCLDLSRTPRVLDSGQAWPCLVTDVPFSQRYTAAAMLDTTEADPPEGDTQLFYAIGGSQVLVAWRGTEMGLPLTDLLTDLTFRPVKPVMQGNCEPAVPCADLTPKGSVHLGFRDAFELGRRVYPRELGETIPGAVSTRELYICGHSLGGALGLVHAASLQAHNPLLYTYGMPRTFTLAAVQGLDELKHFRHVNDTDLIPSVPPEVELDNYFYELYGPLGTTLGLAWSTVQTVASALVQHGDPYCHHGEIAAFYRADQHLEERGSTFPAYRSKDGIDAPYYNKVARRLPEVAKLYLVPSLDQEGSQEARENQAGFTKAMDTESRERLFPRYGNAKPGRVVGIGNHFMNQYQPYLHNQLLESISPQRMHERIAQRAVFKQQMDEYYGRTPEREHLRNKIFLALQERVGEALKVTQQAEGGREALQRFDAVGDPKAYYERIHS